MDKYDNANTEDEDNNKLKIEEIDEEHSMKQKKFQYGNEENTERREKRPSRFGCK